MLSKKQAKIIQSLRHKKFRQKYDLFVVEGEKILQTIISSGKYEIDTVFYTSKAINIGTLKPQIKQVLIDERMMKSVSFLNTSSSCLTLVKTLGISQNKWEKAIYLDGIQDPGNVGTIIRIADWYGLDTVIRSTDSADFFNPKVVQSTMGAFANVNLLEIERDEFFKNHSKDILVADMHGDNLVSVEKSNEFTLVLGSEGKGVHPIFQRKDIKRICIPGNYKRISESLNVSVAAGIIINQLTQP